MAADCSTLCQISTDGRRCSGPQFSYASRIFSLHQKRCLTSILYFARTEAVIVLVFHGIPPYDFTNPPHPATLRGSAQRAATPYDRPQLNFALSHYTHIYALSRTPAPRQLLGGVFARVLRIHRRGRGDCLSNFPYGVPEPASEHQA